VNELVTFLDAVVEFATHNTFAISMGIVFALTMVWTDRIYESYRSAGRERMGLYLAASIQTWLTLAILTSPYWLLSVVIHGAPLENHLRSLHLTTPIAQSEMVNWSATLLLAMAMIAWIATTAQEALRLKPTRIRRLMQPTTPGETVTWSLLVAPSAGVCEEVLFRGMLLPFVIREADDVNLGIAASSLLFGLMHYTQGALGVLATSAMGVVSALGAVYSGSIWPCIAAHTLYNMAVPFLFRLDGTEAASRSLAADANDHATS
jgi:membrane protease YdiL (CAAX protease family)